MLPGNDGSTIDFAVIAYLGRIRIALEQKGLRPGAGGAHRHDEKRNDE
jgi:hypothetical protein